MIAGRLSTLLCVLFVSCLAVSQVLAQAPASPPAEEPAAPSSDTGSQYIIGPGDTLQVFVWRNPDLSATVPVRPDGKISTPLAENITAIGKTPVELAREMEKVLSEYVRTPKVNIIVTAPMSTFSQVRVVGQVGHPQAVAYREGLTVLDVVLAVGGLGQYAAPNRAKIVREDKGKHAEIKVRLGDLINKGDMKQNVQMKPGDVLVVPQSLF